MKRLTQVGLLFGGASVEHEVSLVSARGVYAKLDRARFDVVPLGVTGEGRWISPERSRAILEGQDARVELASGRDDGGRLAAVAGGGGILRITPGEPARPLPLDVVFPVLHGWGGEDGRVQGLLDLAGIPYVGPGVLGSALGMDKEAAKSVFEFSGLPVGPWRCLLREEYRADPAAAAKRLAAELGFPVFVKPANGGSSVGVSRVTEPSGLASAMEAALECDRKAVVEKALDAREVECAVLGNDRPEASIPGEILPSRPFYDYAAKYLDGTSELRIPAPLSTGATETVRQLAVRAFRALDLAGLARVDFFVERGTERVLLNEVNTLPGFTPISMYPKLWEASGVPYAELLGRLVDLALERAATERSRLHERRD